MKTLFHEALYPTFFSIKFKGCEQTGPNCSRFDGSCRSCDTKRGVCEECESGYDGQQDEKGTTLHFSGLL